MTTLSTLSSGTAEQQPAGAGASEVQPPLYSMVESWVRGYFTPMFLHRVLGNPRVRWCPRWWDHAEAIARLTVLWNGWEAARWEPSAKPGWWLDLDHHLPLLTAVDGPFRACRQPEGHRPGKHESESIPQIEPAPDGWWD
jgi:hypothetical protein